jgi:ATP-dependent DNA ligase
VNVSSAAEARNWRRGPPRTPATASAAVKGRAVMQVPQRLLRIHESFDHPDFVFEPKIDGFRALAYVRGAHCELISRNGHVLKFWPHLAQEIARVIRVDDATLDGEICCLESSGRSDFYSLLFRREQPYFYAFDVLSVNGEDICGLPARREEKTTTAHYAEGPNAAPVSRFDRGARTRSVSGCMRTGPRGRCGEMGCGHVSNGWPLYKLDQV